MQKEFATALLDPALPVPPGVVGPDGKISPKRFGVYRNNVVASLIEALCAAYPTVRKIVGEEFFSAMAKLYVTQNPPTSPLMIYYGEKLPGFLADFAPVEHLQYLPDLARLERARRESYHAADAEPDGAAQLARIAPEELDAARLSLHPSVRLVTSKHPVFSIWRYNNGDTSAIEATREDVLISRPRMTVEMRTMPPGAFQFLSPLARGETLGSAARSATDASSDFDLAANIAGILSANILTGATK